LTAELFPFDPLLDLLDLRGEKRIVSRDISIFKSIKKNNGIERKNDHNRQGDRNHLSGINRGRETDLNNGNIAG